MQSKPLPPPQQRYKVRVKVKVGDTSYEGRWSHITYVHEEVVTATTIAMAVAQVVYRMDSDRGQLVEAEAWVHND